MWQMLEDKCGITAADHVIYAHWKGTQQAILLQLSKHLIFTDMQYFRVI